LSGTIVPARAGDNSWERIAYESREYANARRHGKRPAVKAKGKNSHRYQDPTWGDLDYIIDIVTGLAPSNQSDLTTAFGATSRGLKDLQTVRNACFHKHRESWAAVKLAEALYFSSSDTRDPSDLAWKSYIGTTVPSIYDWLDSVVVVCAAVSK
jgi:hypothetical protein